MDNSSTETYIGPTVHDFMSRYRYHTASFRHTIHRNSTELRKHIWTVKDNNIGHFISWRILSSSSPYSTAQVEDATSAYTKNSKSSVYLNCHHLTNVMNLFLNAVTETKRCCVTAEQSN